MVEPSPPNEFPPKGTHKLSYALIPVKSGDPAQFSDWYRLTCSSIAALTAGKNAPARAIADIVVARILAEGRCRNVRNN